MRRSRHSGFTLVEILVVLGIIIMLVGLLFPLIGRFKEAGKRAQCLSNLRTITQAWIAYAGDNERHPCVPGNWTGPLSPYIKSTASYRCPDDTTDLTINAFSYAINGYLNGAVGNPFPIKKLDDIPASATTFVFIEQSFPLIIKGHVSGKISGAFSTPLYPKPPIINTNAWPGQNHKGSKAYVEGSGISFADGHAIFWTYSDTRTGTLQEANAAGTPALLTNSPDVFQLMAWSGGPLPPDPPKLYDPTKPWP